MSLFIVLRLENKLFNVCHESYITGSKSCSPPPRLQFFCSEWCQCGGMGLEPQVVSEGAFLRRRETENYEWLLSLLHFYTYTRVTHWVEVSLGLVI